MGDPIDHVTSKRASLAVTEREKLSTTKMSTPTMTSDIQQPRSCVSRDVVVGAVRTI